jgi:thymidylate kinase
VLDGFLAIARREPERVIEIDARDSMTAVKAKIAAVVEVRLLTNSKS